MTVITRLLRWLQGRFSPPKSGTPSAVVDTPRDSPAVAEQCRAILELNECYHPEWALQQLGLPKEIYQFEKTKDIAPVNAAVRKAFTLTREDFEEYLALHGIEPENHWVSPVPSGADGSYLVKTDQGWLLYYQERECRFDLVRFSELEEARKYLINERLGGWLKHLHRPVLSDDSGAGC